MGELAQDIEDAEEGGRSGILILIERDGRERFLQIGFAKNRKLAVVLVFRRNR